MPGYQLIQFVFRQQTHQTGGGGSVCDKNTGKQFAHCRFCQLCQDLTELHDVKQFQVAHVAQSAGEAKAQSLYNQAVVAKV